MNVLVVDDQPELRELVRGQLERAGVEVTDVATLSAAVDVAARRPFDVVILDLGLPDGSGLDLVEQLRSVGSTAHILVLSGTGDESTRVGALERGADDFVVKPFSVRELVARVLAVRRRRPDSEQPIEVDHLVIDLPGREVTASGRPVELTAMEFDLLAHLATRPGQVVSREELLREVWHSAPEWQQASTVTEHVRRLRAKVEEDPGHPRLVRTVRGVGYRLDPPEQGADPDATGRDEQHPAGASGTFVHMRSRIVAADATTAALLRWDDPSQLLGMHLVDFAAEGTEEAMRRRTERAEAGGPEPRSQLMDLRRSDGTAVRLQVDSVAAEWEGHPARQVTLTRAPDPSVRLRHLVTGVLGDLTDAVIIADLGLHVRSWNEAAERLYGWAETEVLGCHVLDAVPWVSTPAERRQARDELDRFDRWSGEQQVSRRDGSTLRVRVSATVVRDESGEPAGMVMVHRPVDPTRGSVAATDGDVHDIRRGLRAGEFTVHYQPVVTLDTLEVTKVEALARWDHPEHGLLGPESFIAAAERSGEIIELGGVVLEKACRQVAEWRRAGVDLEVAVNLSTRQLTDPGLVERVRSSLASSGLGGDALWLEVTETTVVEELGVAARALERLVELGCHVAIDDFGTGWASLTYLQSFPIHALKVDGSFVVDVGRDAGDTAIVRSILSLGAELDLLVIAEGIETTAQQDVLRRLGCRLGQGFLFGRPGPPEDVLGLVTDAAGPPASTLSLPPGRVRPPPGELAGAFSAASTTSNGGTAGPHGSARPKVRAGPPSSRSVKPRRR